MNANEFARSTSPSLVHKSTLSRSIELSFIWLELTNKCNLYCSHCYASSGPLETLESTVAFKDWVKILLEARELGCTGIQFIGGEPMLSPHLPKLIECASSLKFSEINVFTNGTLLNDTWLSLFKAHSVNLSVSIYSLHEIEHDQFTQRTGSYNRSIKGISNAIAIGIPVHVSVIDPEESEERRHNNIEFLRSLGISSISYDRVRAVGRGEALAKEVGGNGDLCGQCWDNRIAIDPNGNVFPCVFARKEPIGHIRSGLHNVLSDAKLLDFRERIYKLWSTGYFGDLCGACNPHRATGPSSGGLYDDDEPDLNRRRRRWWHSVLREHGKHACFGFFLALPSDRNVANYLKDHGEELHALVDGDCLLLTVTDLKFERPGADDPNWLAAIDDFVSRGHSVRLGRLFSVDYTDFPCLLLFENIDSEAHILIDLKRMGHEEIAEKLRETFSIVHRANSEGQSPIGELYRFRNSKRLRRAGATVIHKIGSFAGTTYQLGVEAAIKAMLDPK